MRHGTLGSIAIVVLSACSASHEVALDATSENDGGPGAACSVEGAYECLTAGGGRECSGGVWVEFWDGPCGPPPPTDAGPPDGGTCFDDAAAVPIESRARVRFRVTGSGWIVQRGIGCSPYAIVREDGSRVPLGLGFQCICECPAPPPPSAESLLSTSSDPVELTWDGRGMTIWSRCVDCSAHGWPGAGWQRYLDGAPQPVLAGRYRAIVPVLDELPAGCTDAGDGTASCSPSLGPPPIPWAPPTYDACAGTRTVEVSFDLPESGEVVVDVDTTP